MVHTPQFTTPKTPDCALNSPTPAISSYQAIIRETHGLLHAAGFTVGEDKFHEHLAVATTYESGATQIATPASPRDPRDRTPYPVES